MKTKPPIIFGLSVGELIILVFIIAVGAYFRLQGFFFSTFAYTYDVGRDLLNVRNMLETHKPLLIGPTTGIPGVFYGPWWYYMLAPVLLISFGNPAGVELFMAVLGIASIVLAFILGKKINGVIFGFIYASLVAISPVLISLSSQIWNPDIAPFFVLLALFCLHDIWDSKKESLKTYFLLGILISFCFDIEIFFGSFLAIGLILSLFLFGNKKINVKGLLLLLFGGLVVLLPRIVFEAKHGFLLTTSFFKFISTPEQSQSLPFFNLITNRLNIFFDLFNFSIASNNQILGLILLVFILVSILIFRSKQINLNKFLYMSILVPGIFLVGTIFFKHDIWPHYLVGLPVFFLLILSICIFYIYEKYKKILFVLPILIIICILNINIQALLLNNSWEGDAAVYRNQVSAIDYVYKNANHEKFKYVVYTPPVYDYTYQYLFDWYGPYKYGYAPSVKANIAYFILEDDKQYPSRLTDWLALRAKDGKIVSSKKVKGGHNDTEKARLLNFICFLWI